MQESNPITKSSNDILNIPDGSPLIAIPGQSFEYIWVIDDWENQTVNPISQNFVINNFTFHMQACIPKQPSQNFSVKIILIEKPPVPKAFSFTIVIPNHTFPEKTITKHSSKAFSRINAYDLFILLPSKKITESEGFLLNGRLTIIFKYLPNSIKSHTENTMTKSQTQPQSQPQPQNSNIEQTQTKQPTNEINTPYEPQTTSKSSSMVLTPSESIIPVISKFSGLKNQGATCYMNSILQVLYHIPSFRRIVYSMPTTGNEDIKTSIPLNLQSLFCRMQITKSACSTTDLTRSFGWDRSYTIIQHDVVEFERELIQNLEAKLKDTELSGHISSLITGKMRTCIKCKNVDFTHTIDEDFDSLNLIVRGSSNLEESLKKELETQELIGDEQYKTDEFGPQDATVCTEFVTFPPILMIQLQRFEHNFQNNRNIKINDHFEYPEEIDLSAYLVTSSYQKKRNNTYILFAVIVHSGSAASGHYYTYIKPSFEENKWYKFDDTKVTLANDYDAIKSNFGDTITSNGTNIEKNYSAYLLVYARKEDLHSIFEPVTDESVPSHIRQLTVAIDNKRKSELPPDYIDLRLDSETSIRINSMRWLTGFHNNTVAFVVRIDSDEKVKNLYGKVADFLQRPVDQLRLWKCSTYSIPESPLIANDDEQVLSDVLGKSADIFVQCISPEKGEKVEVEKDSRVVFMKFFFLPKSVQTNASNCSLSENQNTNTNDSQNANSTSSSSVANLSLIQNSNSCSCSSIDSKICVDSQSKNFDTRFEAAVRYIGAKTVKSDSHVSDLFPIVNSIVKIPQDTPLTVFEETINHKAQLVTDPQNTCIIDVGRMLIFQISPGIEIEAPSPTQFDMYIDDKFSSKVPLKSFSSSGFFDPQWSNLPIVSYYQLHPSLAPTTIGQYMDYKLRTLESVMFDYDDESQTGLSIVRFPANLSWPALKQLISFSVNRNYDPYTDSMRIYKRDPSKGVPSKYPISMRYNSSIASSLAGSMPKRGDRLHLFFSIIHGIPEAMIESMTNYNIQYSEDGFSVSRSTRLLIMKNSTLKKIAFEMQNRGILPQSDSIRALHVIENRIVGFYQKVDDTIVPIKNNSILRFENVPIEHRNFDDRVDLYVPVSQGYLDVYGSPHFVVDPFLFICKVDDRIGQIRDDLLKWAEIKQENRSTTVVMSLYCKDENYTSEGFLVEQMKNDDIISVMVKSGGQIFLWRPELEKMKEEVHHVTFVDHPPPRKNENENTKKREVEQPVKIFN